MHVLLLGEAGKRLLGAIEKAGDVAHLTSQVLSDGEDAKCDWLVAFGYRHKIEEPVLRRLGCQAVNLHTSYLPWNRGAHPNLWSWIDGTPKGVTLHVVDGGIDTGPIIAQQEVALSEDATFAATYAVLMDAAVALFTRQWPQIRDGAFQTRPQDGRQASRHFVRDLDASLLPQGWNTPIATALALRMNRGR